MGCFCHATLSPLTLALPQLNVSEQLMLSGAGVPLRLSGWLSAHGMPALPWQPDPKWLDLPLPRPQITPQAVATISAMAQLRAQVLAQFGIDLLVPGQARGLARIVATMNTQLSSIANLHPNFNPLGWLQLNALNNAIDQIQLALQAGLFAPPANLMLSLTMPGGLPMPQWFGFLRLLRLLAPMIAVCAQLGVTEMAQLSAALRTLAQLRLPALVAPQLLANLNASLSAVAQLRGSLGVNPLALGFPALVTRVQAKLALLLPALSAALGINLTGGGGSLLAELMALLPNLPVLPTSFATPAVVQAALGAQMLAGLNWQVPPMLPALQAGLPTCHFAEQLQAVLGITAVLPAPCASGCEAARIMHALENAATG